jgi:hypothetical protein
VPQRQFRWQGLRELSTLLPERRESRRLPGQPEWARQELQPLPQRQVQLQRPEQRILQRPAQPQELLLLQEQLLRAWKPPALESEPVAELALPQQRWE